MNFSLKTTSYTVALIVALILGFLLLLGSRQYRSQKDFESIIEHNERIVFQFATIREHITESLLEGNLQQLKGITTEVEQLNSNISHILQEPLIPAEYKLAFAGQVDLGGITLLLRTIGSGDTDPAKIRNLNQEIRTLGDRLILFDRVIANHLKRTLVSFQSVIIGTLALILFAIVNILVFWHRQVTVPLLDLNRQIKEVIQGRRSEIRPLRKSGEVADLALSFQNFRRQQDQISEMTVRHKRLVTITRDAGKLSETATTSEEIFASASNLLLQNKDYCLVWFGTESRANQIDPITIDASTTMSQRECDECMNALQKAAQSGNNEQNAALTALRSREPVVLDNFLSTQPRGPFKNTPFSAETARWCALPLNIGATVYGVLNIYSTHSQSFTDAEISLLSAMASEISLALHVLAFNRALENEKNMGRLVSETLQLLVVQIRPDGTVSSCSPEARKILAIPPDHDLQGIQWISLLPPEEQEKQERILEKAVQRETGTLNPEEMTLTDAHGKNHAIRYRYVQSSPINATTGLFWVGTDISAPAWISRSQARMRAICDTLFSTSRALIMTLSGDGKIIDCNPAVSDYLGIPRDKAISLTLSETLFKDTPVPAGLKEVLDNKSGETTARFGEPANDYNVVVAPITLVDTGEEYLLFHAENISHQTQLQDDMIKAAKLAAMGELAIGIAHEINNLSNGLINYTQILSEEIGPAGGDNSRYLNEILDKVIQEGERIAYTVQQLLLFNSNRKHMLETVQIGPVIADALEISRHLFKNDGIHATITLPPTLPPVKINVHNMRHVLLTLISNARYALNSHYTGVHASKRLEITGEPFNQGEKGFLRLCCTDWGQGISKENLPKIFDPFFSTKPSGESTGLGLCIARAFIEEIGGAITVESVPESKTTFSVDLPLA